MYSNQNKQNFRLDSDNDINTPFQCEPQNIDIINRIFNILYEKEFPSILIISSKNFLRNIDINSDAIIQKNLSTEDYTKPSTMATINKIKEKILNKYNEEYSFLSEMWKKYQKNPENFENLTKFRRHCDKCDKIAYHNCTQLSSGQLICIEKSEKVLYYLCVECKKCLRNNRLYLYCKPCNEIYFSSDKIFEEENEESFHPATWEKYHCFILKNEIMRCLNCHEYLYIMKPNNKLVCLDKNCHFSTRPDRIMWNCSKCGVEFLSPAQVYDEDLFNEFNQDIKYALLNKQKAKPAKTLYCCGQFLSDVTFFHNNNCDGLLYLGNFNNKDIIVCEKCEYSNYLSDFIWTCPICKNEISLNNSNDFSKRTSRNPSIKVNKKLDKINKDKNNEIDKKNGEFSFSDSKYSLLKTDNSISTNRDTCSNTLSSTTTNVNNNSNGNNTIVKEKESLIINHPKNNIIIGSRSEIKKTKSFNTDNVGKSKQILSNKNTLQEENNNLLDSLRNTLVYSTLEKKNKMFKIKNRVTNTSNQKDEEKIDVEETKPGEKYKPENFNFARRSVYVKSSKKTKFALDNNLQIDDDNICSNLDIVNLDSDILNNKISRQKTVGNEDTNKRKIEIISKYVPSNTTNNESPYISPYIFKRAFHGSIYRKDNMRKYIDNINNDDSKSINIKPTINVEKILTNNEPLNYNKKISSDKRIRFNAIKIKCDNFKVKKNENIENNKRYKEKISPIKISKHNTTSSNFFSDKNRIKNNTSATPDVRIEKIVHVHKSSRDNKNNKSTGKIEGGGEFKNRGRRYYQLMTQSGSKNNVIGNKEKENKKDEVENERLDCASMKHNNKKEFDVVKAANSSKNISKLTFKKLNNNFRLKESRDTNNLKNTLIDNFNINDDNNNNDNNGNNDNNNNNTDIKSLINIGLINHQNLISSPDKINEIQKTCTIPSFEDNDFSYIVSIGEGSYGTIFLVSEKNTGNEYALKKIICQDINDVIKIKKQFELAYSLKHENIMRIYKLQFKCLDFTTYGINVLMEKAQMDWGMEITARTDKKKYYTEKELINIMKQLINALEFLQKNNVAHRDIKPQNILIYPNDVYKVADLGEAKNINMKSRLFTLKGSEMYLSPALFEGLRNKKEGIIHNVYKSDVFSLGYCFLYAMCLNINVLDEVRKISIKNNYVKVINGFIGKNKYSDKFLELIGKMIIDSEAQRCDFIELNNMIKNFLD